MSSKPLSEKWLYFGGASRGDWDHCAVDLDIAAGAAEARQQANLIDCAANMRGIGQAMSIYESENNGYPPYGLGMYDIDQAPDLTSNTSPYATNSWMWCDTLSLLTGAKESAFPNPAAGTASKVGSIPAGEPNQATDYSGIFHDVDVADEGRVVRESDYFGNLRVFMNQWMADNNTTYTGTATSGPKGSTTLPPAWARSFYLRQAGTVQHSAEVAAVWDGPLNFVSSPGLSGQWKKSRLEPGPCD